MDAFFATFFDSGPVLYGVVVILGICTLWWKLITGRITSFLLEAGIFWLVFSLHGGTMTGGMSAAVAALLGGFLIPLTTAIARRSR
jgi:hypothetical protein